MQTVFEVENLKPLVSAQFESLLRHHWMCRSMMLMYLNTDAQSFIYI